MKPPQRQHGDVVGRRGRADEAFQRFGYAAHDLAAAATCMRAKHGLEPVLAEQVAARIVRLRHAIAIEVKRFPRGQDQLACRVRRVRPYAENHALGVFDRLAGRRR